MLSASFFRDRAAAKRYSDDSQREHGKGCAFCILIRDGGTQVVETRQHCLVIKNRYPYDNWDNYGVIDQLMVIPRRHVVAFHELLPEEQRASGGGERGYLRCPEDQREALSLER